MVDAGSVRGDAGLGDVEGEGEEGCAEGDENGPFSLIMQKSLALQMQSKHTLLNSISKHSRCH